MTFRCRAFTLWNASPSWVRNCPSEYQAQEIWLDPRRSELTDSTILTANIYWALAMCQVVSILSTYMWLHHLILWQLFMINVLLFSHFTDDETGAEIEDLVRRQCRAKLQTQAVCLRVSVFPHSTLLCSVDQSAPFSKIKLSPLPAGWDCRHF